jgi:hypothetical protein
MVWAASLNPSEASRPGDSPRVFSGNRVHRGSKPDDLAVTAVLARADQVIDP